MIEEDISKEDIISAYRNMVLERFLDKKLLGINRQGFLPFYIPNIGHEALHAAIGMAIRDDDFFYPYYRDLGSDIARVGLDFVLAQMFSTEMDNELGRDMPLHISNKAKRVGPVITTVGGHLMAATGVAYSYKYQKKPGIVITTFGDGATSTPDFHVSMNFAAVYSLPLLFICENNQWAISYPVEEQTKVEISKKAEAYGFTGIKIDGNNFIEAYHAIRNAIKDVEKNKMPLLIDAVTYRMGPHTTADDPNKYRKTIINEGDPLDPLSIIEDDIKKMKILNDEEISNIKNEINNMVSKEVERYEKMNKPGKETLFKNIYENEPWYITEERGEIE
ncbi:thiamine pyrophosphate-dependent dehydrogenase E1 component subunit alpha [Picrophilus oshimae]|uniref:Pyruvate dehydrogenase E1 component alpha subunit n=1 Tax=Picrophilus torridus (strain ATCC 700027 / DSM 9790 / JCM 10055 / NBRC 100828 / KAW 2/3) TaxID=1122961 RepID=Q6L1L8_PICTO|nr:thiamine pyrophosphate-dependent dehydrogenase E1 component subunit alpha [Picrophilus oshimae]AAT43134.1 pyruvate dehydrogenase E1 component alpha subunit [Picrophilus oshimae DSM 9789]